MEGADGVFRTIKKGDVILGALGERPKKVRKADKFENSFVLMAPEATRNDAAEIL